MSQVPEGYFALIGNYYVGKTIGRGTFGKVKMGLHTHTKQNVAIKILDKDKIIDESDKIRVGREIQILRKIRHPHIIQLYEIIESQTQLFLITEYAPNNELFDFIVKRNRLNERQAAKFLLQILSAVEYLHQNNIVHRDLKPENLLLDYNNSIKDFGLSNMYEEGETLKTACGSPCYAAPEMVSGKRYQGLKTDIWSCGIILYAMLCGYLPFEDSNTTELYKKIINDPLKLPKFLTERSKSMLNAILEKDPEKRLTIEQIRKHDFCILNSNQPILKGITFGKEDILVDPFILQIIKDEYGIDSDQARVMIQNNKHNQITATYYLLLNSHIRNGGVSISDLSRPPPPPPLKKFHPTSANSAQKNKNDKENNTQQCDEDRSNANQTCQQNNQRTVVSANNRPPPNQSSTPIQKITEYNKLPTNNNFQQLSDYVQKQQKLKSTEKETSPSRLEKTESKEQKNTYFINNHQSESSAKEFDDSRGVVKRKCLTEEKSPIVMMKLQNQKNMQEQQMNASPDLSPIIVDDDQINQSQKQSSMKNSKKYNKQEEIAFIKSYNNPSININESTVKKQNFFQEEKEQESTQVKNSHTQNTNDQHNQTQLDTNFINIPNSTFGGQFIIGENASATKNVHLPLIEKEQNTQQPQQEQERQDNQKLNQEYHIYNFKVKQHIQNSNNRDQLTSDNLSKSKDDKSEDEQAANQGVSSPQRYKLNTKPNNRLSNPTPNHTIPYRNSAIQSESYQLQQENKQLHNQSNTNIPPYHNSSLPQRNSSKPVFPQHHQSAVPQNQQSQQQQQQQKQNNVLSPYIQSVAKQHNRGSIQTDKNIMGRQRNGFENNVDIELNKSSDNSEHNQGVYSIQRQDATTTTTSQNIKTGQQLSRRIHSKDESKNQEDKVTQSLQVQISQQTDSNQQNFTSNKSGSKIIVKIHHKTKSDSALSRKMMVMNNINVANQKENVNVQHEQQSTLQSSDAKSNFNHNFSQSAQTQNQMKSTNEKISHLIRSANQKGSLNTIQKEFVSNNQWKYYQPNFFNNQSYLMPNPQNISNNQVSSIRNNNQNTSNIIDNSLQTISSAQNYYSKQLQKTPTASQSAHKETSIVRQKLKQISSRQSSIGNRQSLKVKIRKSATPELNNINQSNQLIIDGQQNLLQQQRRSNSNDNITDPSSMNNHTLSPRKRIKMKQISRSSRRFVSAERENNQNIQQSILEESQKPKFIRQGSSSIQRNMQHFLNKIEKQSSLTKQMHSEVGDGSQTNNKKPQTDHLIPIIIKEVKEPKIRIISESPMYKKEQSGNESKYYLGLKQQMIQKEPLICNFSMNNESNLQQQLTNNEGGVSSTMDEFTSSSKVSNQRLQLSNYSHNLNVLNNQNKSYLNNTSNNSRISANMNDQLQSAQFQMENSKSDNLKLKVGVTNQLSNNSYSLANVSKYTARKQKIHSGIHHITNSIITVNHLATAFSQKEKQ